MMLRTARFHVSLPNEPLLELLNPGKLAPAVAVSLLLGIGAGVLANTQFGFPIWSITLIALLALLPVGIVKWRADLHAYGFTVMLLSILLVSQGAHTIEHITQWMQYYIMYLPARKSSGLISAANSEWVHFVWNWLVLLTVVALVRGGMRNPLAWVLLAVAAAHTFEHTYMFIRYQQVLDELRGMNVYTVTAQGLPGILGRDGWLARSPVTQNTFLCTFPVLTTANRLDVHFWWNTLEMVLLLGAGSWFLRARGGLRPATSADQLSR